MIKIAVCGDEKEDRENTCALIRQFGRDCSEEYEIKAYESGDQFLVSGFRPDIIFLDIMMEAGDGIETALEMKKRNFETIIVYIAETSEKMPMALNRIHSYGYLVKPLVKEDLFQILSDAVMWVTQNKRKSYVTFFSGKNKAVRLIAMDIYYFEYCSRKVKIFTADKIYICTSEKISSIADKMEPYGFAMSHQSFVVNLYLVERIDGQMLVMKNGARIYLAQKRASKIRKRLVQIAKAPQ